MTVPKILSLEITLTYEYPTNYYTPKAGGTSRLGETLEIP
jgi:hypothetical protein